MKSLCVNRINKDLKEIAKSPLEGIGIASLDNDPKKYIVNMRIMSGVFEGYCLQLLLTFPDQYPIKPPTILIYPGQYFDNTYHHHIFQSNLKDEEGNHFQKFCFDLLQNDFISTTEANTGWNPSYTISTLLLQVQIFLSNPDYPNGYIPEKEKVDKLMKSMDTYKKSFIIINDKNEEIIIEHTWKNPYPEMHFETKNNEIKNKENDEFNTLKEIKENLTCFMSRINYIDNSNIILGYPLKKINNKDLIPIPEILSYDGFIQESTKTNLNLRINENLINEIVNDNLNNFYPPINNNNDTNNTNNNNINNTIGINQRLRNNTFFLIRRRMIRYLINYFSERYNDNVSYKSANNELYNSWLPIYINNEHFEKNKETIIKYFQKNNFDEFNFQTEDIFEILLNILTEMITKMIEDNISSSFLKCFFQYALMFKKLEKKYKNSFINYQNDYLNKFFKKLKEFEGSDMKKYFMKLFILILFCDETEKFDNLITKIKNRIYIPLLDYATFSDFYFIDKNKLFKDIKNNDIDGEIACLIFKVLKYFWIKKFAIKYFFLEENIINAIKKEMKNSFLELYSFLTFDEKNSIKDILIEKSNFSKCLNINEDLKKSKLLNSEFTLSKKTYEYIYLLDFLLEKIKNEKFIDNLENNFGVCLETEQYIEEFKNKTLDEKSIINILNKYNLFSIEELNLLNDIYQNRFYFTKYIEVINSKANQQEDFFLNTLFLYKNMMNPNFYQILFNFSLKLGNFKYENIIKEKNKIKFKEKIKRSKFNIKISYDKINNKRNTKYINQKNINRLLLFKRNHY